MNQYETLYIEKRKTVKECVNLIREDELVAVSTCGNEPKLFLSNLHQAIAGLRKIRLINTMTQTDHPFLSSGYRDKIDVMSSFLFNAGRKAMADGNIDFLPAHMHNIAGRYPPPNVLAMAVTPMDRHGYFRYSLECLFEKEWLQSAHTVILEVNPQIPVVYGDNQIHISDVTALFENDSPIITLESTEPGEIEERIGRHVAGLVNDGDTIQLGIGMIPNAVGKYLADKKDLGVHTEMISNVIVDLVENGVVTGKKKTLHEGRIIGAFALGNERLYRFLECNPAVAMMPASYVCAPWVIAKNDNFVSINTGLSVDFYGQICSESIGIVQYSGTGGQNDTAEGAIHSRGGRSIIALRSTAKQGCLSTISPCLAPGSVVTMSANNIDYIVTEYGVALMKTQTLRQRTENLIRIAHPDFREKLTEEAKIMGRL